ncbi:uncharacterized protein TNCV_227771 [Trichonephila clavipes]|nr:uncharacterized protein TNCV_227771 [Trichonephila clavipes]
MWKKSPFAIQKALVGIGGELKSVKRLRSGDLLIETNSALQTKSFLLAKSFLDCPVSVVPHKSLNSCRGVISEPDLLTTTNAEILDGFSGQGVIQPRPHPYQLKHPTTSNKFAALQPSEPLLESATTSNSELSKTSKVPQNVKMNSKNRRKRTKAQNAETEIKMAKHKPRKSRTTELTIDDEDMIMYDVQAEELEPDPENKYAMIECFVNNPSEYMRTLTPTRFRKSRS